MTVVAIEVGRVVEKGGAEAAVAEVGVVGVAIAAVVVACDQ